MASPVRAVREDRRRRGALARAAASNGVGWNGMGAGAGATGGVGTSLIDAAVEPASFDFSPAGDWSILVLLDGTPVDLVELPAPGTAGSVALVRAALVRRADGALARRRLIEDILERIGSAGHQPSELPQTSVVVCTHRRPADLPRVLDALGRLDPAPAEVIVIDNAPGEADCRELVKNAGFRYLREDRQGLDNARNAGIRVASGDVIAFTDDDCVPAAGWLSAFGELFDDPSVGAVTGPMFPYRLDTPARVRMERVASMGRGFRRRTFDWQTISAVHAGAVGVGANMAFRRSVLAELGEQPFPPELDAGTPTESGGDTFVIARVIAHGHRVVYAPEMFGFHMHREDPQALHRAVRGYGAGVSAAMTKLLLEEGEGETWRGWWWLVNQYLRTERRRLIGRADAYDARLSREYILGGLLGPLRWRESARAQRRVDPAPADPPAAVAATELPAGAVEIAQPRMQAPLISIVIPTHRRPAVLARCLDSLAKQTVAAGSFEVLVVDDAVPAQLEAESLTRAGLDIRLLRSGGGGASAARNLGAREARAPLLLFLDDDMVAEAPLVERHLAGHAARQPAAVVGSYPPSPPAPGLMASAVAFWWSDAFEAMRHAVRPTFSFLMSGNLSVPRGAFLELGGFAADIPYRREDWELGIRWMAAGYEVIYEPRACARHEFGLPTAARLRGAELEGYGDAVLVRRYPGVLGSLPLVAHRPARGSGARRLGFALAEHAHAQRVGIAALDLLESANLRLAWLRVLRPLQVAAYRHGLERGGYSPEAIGSETILDCELLSEDPIVPSGSIAPTLRITLSGRALALVRPRDGYWGPHVAAAVADAVDSDDIELVAAARGWLPVAEAAPPTQREHDVEVIVGPGGPAAEHWREVARRVAESQSELVALLPHDPAPSDARWLREALVAFDGDRVDGVFGVRLDDERPLQPLFLHDLPNRPAFDVGDAPDYLIVRARALRELGGIACGTVIRGRLTPVMVLIERILDSGAVIARRDVHGLAPRAPVPALEEGRAWAVARVQTSQTPLRTLARGGAGLIATAAWDVFKARGRPDRRRAMAIAGAAQGALSAAGARRALRSPRTSSVAAAADIPRQASARHEPAADRPANGSRTHGPSPPDTHPH
jgi:glycosyltransferase involved in cell wall biosynthesis